MCVCVCVCVHGPGFFLKIKLFKTYLFWDHCQPDLNSKEMTVGFTVSNWAGLGNERETSLDQTLAGSVITYRKLESLWINTRELHTPLNTVTRLIPVTTHTHTHTHTHAHIHIYLYYLSIYPSIHSSIHLSIHPFIHPSIYLSTHPPTHPHTYLHACIHTYIHTYMDVSVAEWLAWLTSNCGWIGAIGSSSSNGLKPTF